MSQKVMVRGTGEKTFVSNALRFATVQEAESYAQDLYSRWFGMDEYRIEESEEPVNYKWENGQAIRIPE